MTLAVLFIHLITTIARLAGPGGARSVVAESVLVKQQLLILNRSRHRSPNLRVCDRVVAGLCTLLMRPGRLIRCAIVLKPSTLLSLHRTLKNRKYRLLFSLKLRKKPGPEGPGPEVIAAVVQMKQRNPTWGCPRIAQQIPLAFDIQINKDVVRRILAARYQPEPDSADLSWLTFLGHMKDSLWSLDLFRCESATLGTHCAAPLDGSDLPGDQHCRGLYQVVPSSRANTGLYVAIMADIFVSYAQEDESKAEALAGALRGEGWSVFRDRAIPPGQRWDEHIGRQMEYASCVVVLWSEAAVGSHWVLEEAEAGRQRGILVPVLIEAQLPPLGFRTIQAADLIEW
jgi:TIR domain